jgi:hypothetical protein
MSEENVEIVRRACVAAHCSGGDGVGSHLPESDGTRAISPVYRRRHGLPNPLPTRGTSGRVEPSSTRKPRRSGASSGAGGGTRTPDTRIMMTARRGPPETE